MTFYGAFRPDHSLLPGETVQHTFITHATPPEDMPVPPKGVRSLFTFEPWQGDDPQFLADYGWVTWREQLPREDRDAPVTIRWGHEMNGKWGFPWQTDPATFLAGWRSFFRHAPGAVQRVWGPNVVFDGSAPLEPFWPGDDAVDLIGLSGYGRRENHYPWPDELFGPTIAEIRRFTDKPIFVAETGCGLRNPKDKAAWFAGLAQLKRLGIVGVVILDEDKRQQGEEDWSIGGPRTAPGKAWRSLVAGGERGKGGKRR